MDSDNRLLALDGLRGLAVIGVLLFHDERLSGGFLGVDLFFALSGFLITGLLMQEVRSTGTVQLLRFWERRFRRLLPAFLLLLALIMPLMYWWGSAAQLSAARHSVLPALAYVANWHEIFQGSDYWTLFSDPSPLTHLWSLAVEQQFYVVWPAVFLLISRLRSWKTTITIACITIITTSGVLMWLLYDPANPNRSYEGTDTRAASILFGALAAIIGAPALIDRLRPAGRPAGHPGRVAIEVGQWTIVAGLAWAWWNVDGASGSGLAHGGFLLHSAAGALLAASLASTGTTSVQRVLSWRPLRAAGAVSYGWYLWHWPIYVILTSERTGWHGWALSAARWSVSLAAAIISYRLVEMPVRRRRVLVSGRSQLAALAACALLIVAVVVLVPRPSTVPAAFDPTTITLPTTTMATDGSTTTVGPDDAPATSSVPPPPLRTLKTLIWSGDSVAFDAAPGVVAAFGAAGVVATYAGYVGTGLVPEGGADTWAIFVQPVLDQHPDVVLFQFSGWDSRFTVAQQQRAFEVYTDAVLGTGAALVFVTPPPMDPAKVDNDVSVMVGLATALAAERPADVLLVDANALWGAFAYDIEGDGVPDRKPDGVHFCPQGSAKYGYWLTTVFAGRFAGVWPVEPGGWAGGEWVRDPRYNDPLGACV